MESELFLSIALNITRESGSAIGAGLAGEREISGLALLGWAHCVRVCDGKGGLGQSCAMEAGIGIKMPPKVVLLAIKEHIVFRHGNH